MSFTRLDYDPKAYETAYKASVGVFPYMTDRAYTQKSKYCRCEEPTKCTCFRVSGTNGEVTPFEPFHRTTSIVDAESDVQNRSRKFSKDPSTQWPYNGAKAPHTLEAVGEVGLNFSNRHTRVDYPLPNREQSLYPERFYNTQIDMQALENIDDNTKIGINSYLAERDNFKAYIPSPINDAATLPPAPRSEDIQFNPISQTGMYYGDPTSILK